MSVYLHDIPLDEAKGIFEKALQKSGLWQPLGVEEIPLNENAVGRILAEPIWAKLSSPHYNASAMDGFAVEASSTHGASETSPIELVVGQTAAYVDTGDALPAWANAVIPIELIEAFDHEHQPLSNLHKAHFIRFRASTPPWRHVRTVGEDIISSQLVLPEGQQMRPVDLGAAAASGCAAIKVYRKPRVSILPTGSELVSIGSQVKPGDIIEYNSLVLAAQVAEWGGIPLRQKMVQDHLETISKAVQLAAAQSDLVLINAGSSAGSEDFSAQIVQTLGELLVHGIAVRPGHPVILGMLHLSDPTSNEKRNIPIIGIPGFPVSAALTGEIFVEPLLSKWSGKNLPEPIQITATITKKITSPAGDDDYLRVIVGKVSEDYKAAPVSRGAGVITSLVRADGITVIPRSIQGLEAGSKVKVRLYRSTVEIDRSILAIGSHDMTLDLLAQHLQRYQRRLISANVGSVGGLLALRREEAHIAGSHLLDPATGDYNKSYLKQYIPDLPVKLVTWAEREQGLIIKPGNPKNICTLHDLQREDVTFINRQRGSGTRLLLDYHLSQNGLDAGKIRGYQLDEYTHLNVAIAVDSGRSDCGLGIAAAAEALGLDFIPLFTERYDLVIPCKYLEGHLLDPLFDIMNDTRFRKDIAQLKGYIFDRMGEIVIDC